MTARYFLQQADTKLVALDAKTGEVKWTAQNGNPKAGETNTNAPQFSAIKCSPVFPAASSACAGDSLPTTSRLASRSGLAYSTGPDSEMLLDPDKTMTWADGKMVPVGADSSLKSQEGRPVEVGRRHDLGLVCLGPQAESCLLRHRKSGTWNPTQRPGDNKWSMSIFARDLNTGKAKWVYQMTPHDEWDYDGVNEMILADLPMNGKKCRQSSISTAMVSAIRSIGKQDSCWLPTSTTRR